MFTPLKRTALHDLLNKPILFDANILAGHKSQNFIKVEIQVIEQKHYIDFVLFSVKLHQLEAAADVALCIYVLDVLLHCVVAYEKLVGDGAVCQAVQEKPGNFLLCVGELRQTAVIAAINVGLLSGACCSG